MLHKVTPQAEVQLGVREQMLGKGTEPTAYGAETRLVGCIQTEYLCAVTLQQAKVANSGASKIKISDKDILDLHTSTSNLSKPALLY